MRRLFSKVGLHDFGVADHDLRVAVGDLAPGHEHRDALGEFHHGAHHVLDHDGEGLGDLEAAREAHADSPVRGMPADVLALEADAPFLVPQRPGDAVDERALARAVRPDEADALAGPHHEVHGVERSKTAKSLGHATHLEQRFGHQRPLRRRQASTQPMMPFGASVTKSTSSTPTMSRFQADETVTWTTCCTVPRRTAPMSGPIQLIMPPMSGMAMLFTA